MPTSVCSMFSIAAGTTCCTSSPVVVSIPVMLVTMLSKTTSGFHEPAAESRGASSSTASPAKACTWAAFKLWKRGFEGKVSDEALESRSGCMGTVFAAVCIRAVSGECDCSPRPASPGEPVLFDGPEERAGDPLGVSVFGVSCSAGVGMGADLRGLKKSIKLDAGGCGTDFSSEKSLKGSLLIPTTDPELNAEYSMMLTSSQNGDDDAEPCLLWRLRSWGGNEGLFGRCIHITLLLSMVKNAQSSSSASCGAYRP